MRRNKRSSDRKDSFRQCIAATAIGLFLVSWILVLFVPSTREAIDKLSLLVPLLTLILIYFFPVSNKRKWVQRVLRRTRACSLRSRAHPVPLDANHITTKLFLQHGVCFVIGWANRLLVRTCDAWFSKLSLNHCGQLLLEQRSQGLANYLVSLPPMCSWFVRVLIVPVDFLQPYRALVS